MSTLKVVEEILRERKTPMVVRAIVAAAGDRLPTRSRTPDTVVARDLAMDIKKHPDSTLFARVAPGQYTLREYAQAAAQAVTVAAAPAAEAPATTAAQPLAAPPIDAPVTRPLGRAPSSPPVMNAAGPLSATSLERREDVFSQ